MQARVRGLVSVLVLVFAAHVSIAEPTKLPGKAVFIILDGIPADVIERVPTPVLDEIARAGGYARSHAGGELGGPTQTPTISAPGYMSLITGTWGNKHNVWDNDQQSPDYRYWNLFRIVETVAPERRHLGARQGTHRGRGPRRAGSCVRQHQRRLAVRRLVGGYW